MAVATVRRPLFWREGRWLAPPPHAPGETSQRTAVASAAGVPPGHACRGPPRACESHGAAGDSSAGMASRAGLRQPSSACGRSRAGPTAARLRAVGARERASGSRFASAYGRAARPQRYARLPPAPRSARMLRPSASGAALSQPAP